MYTNLCAKYINLRCVPKPHKSNLFPHLARQEYVFHEKDCLQERSHQRMGACGEGLALPQGPRTFIYKIFHQLSLSTSSEKEEISDCQISHIKLHPNKIHDNSEIRLHGLLTSHVPHRRSMEEGTL